MRQRKNKSQTDIPREVELKNGIYAKEDIWTDKQKEQIIKKLKFERIQDNIKNLQLQTVRRLDDELSALVDGVLGELERYEAAEKEDIIFSSKAKHEHHHQRKKDEEKKFIARASPLSELMEVRHIRSVYHIFVAVLIISLISGATGDYLRGGWNAIRIGIRHVPTAFGHFDRAILLWTLMFLSTCLIHQLLNIWNKFLHSITSKISRYIFNLFSIIFLISYLILTNYTVLKHMGNTGVASSGFLLMEQTRLMMKIHAYVRTNVARSPVTPDFSTYFYFLFAPTLVYRDTYPRNSHTNWRIVRGCLFEFFGAILMQSCIIELHIIPEYSNFGLDKHTPGTLAALLSRTVLPSFLLLLCGFYLLLHCWLNIWAELLRFADRRFYDCWWNANSYEEYYRTWNCVVHDYLHTYIYKDLKYLTSPTVAKIGVFAVSAIVHEYILSCVLGYFYPVLFVQFFGLGVALGFIKSAAGKGRAANVFLWVSLAYGIGLQFSLYGMESFARINCPKTDASFIDYFIPRSWSCNGLDL